PIRHILDTVGPVLYSFLLPGSTRSGIPTNWASAPLQCTRDTNSSGSLATARSAPAPAPFAVVHRHLRPAPAGSCPNRASPLAQDSGGHTCSVPAPIPPG